ncbi:MAG TPA: hypothetical protein VK421_01245 [Pyrinomonadaceae bacterium]|nr:hypothetical protein [Pyrinomonadaceae bacterium]
MTTDTNLRFRLLAALAAALCVLAAGARTTLAQGKQAIVVLRTASGGGTGCDGTAELNYLVVNDVKINGKDEVRLLNGFSGPGASAAVTRATYEDSGKGKIRDLIALKWGPGGIFYAVSVSGQAPVVVVPENMKPQKNVDTPLTTFYGTALTGEAREGKQKRVINLQLSDVWKVYPVPEGSAPADALFKHAAEEKNVPLWEAFLQKTSNHRMADANALMRDALINCARAELGKFTEGDYGALERARAKNSRAQSVREDETTRQLTADVEKARGQVEGIRLQVEQLIGASKWDEAIDAAEPIKKYLPTWPKLSDIYGKALSLSHNQHLFAGQKAFESKQFEVSRDDCAIAWRRLPNSNEAHQCVCKARSSIALRDSTAARQRRQPKSAKEILEAQLSDPDCSRDAPLTAALREANCEYAQQLQAEARQLIAAGSAAASVPSPRAGAGAAAGRQSRRGAAASPATAASTAPASVNVKAITAQNKRDFRAARERLLRASELCPEDQIRAMLDAANRRLSEYCVEEARKAAQRGDFGTAYVYLQTAQEYTPNNSEVTGLLVRAREQSELRTQVSVGVVFGNRSHDRDADRALNEIVSEMESVVASAGLARAVVLDRSQATNALRGIQSGAGSATPTVIFFGELLSGSVNRRDDPRNVEASYQEENPAWKEADRYHDARNAELKRCRKQPGVDCSALDAEVARLRANRDRHERYLTRHYTYRENHIRYTGELKMSFRATDSISRSTRAADTLSSAVDRGCVERSGVRHGQDVACNLGGETDFMAQMINEVKREAYAKVAAQLRDLPLTYYARARSATNRQQAVEDYLRFLFLTANKSTGEAQEARSFLLNYDPELKTDGVMR